eukprot:6990883-Prymnesium_polylepis.1
MRRAGFARGATTHSTGAIGCSDCPTKDVRGRRRRKRVARAPAPSQWPMCARTAIARTLITCA